MAITAAGIAAGNNANSATSVAMSATVNVTAGQLVVVCGAKFTTGITDTFASGDCAKSSGTATIGTITQDKTDLREDTPSSGQCMAVSIWSAVVTGSGTLAFTISNSDAGSYLLIGIEAFNGNWDDTRVETTATNFDQAADTTPAHSGNLTTAGAAVIVGAGQFNTSGAVTITDDGAFTSIYKNGTSTDDNGAFAYRIVSSGTTDRAEWGLSGIGWSGWIAAAVAYREASLGVPFFARKYDPTLWHLLHNTR